jgi:hypothetical protein
MSEVPEERRRRTGWFVWLLLLLFVIVLLALLAQHLYRQQQRREAVQLRQQQNSQLGLPRDYPLELVPLYAGVEVLEAARDTATSSEGEPMDYWYVHAQIDEDKDPIFDFYNDYLLAQGMRQTQHIGIPTGYGVDFADERHVVSIVIERKPTDELMQLELKVYRIQD